MTIPNGYTADIAEFYFSVAVCSSVLQGIAVCCSLYAMTIPNGYTADFIDIHQRLLLRC